MEQCDSEDEQQSSLPWINSIADSGMKGVSLEAEDVSILKNRKLKANTLNIISQSDSVLN